MVGVAVGLALGAGLFCIWWACWASSPDSAPATLGPGRGGAFRAGRRNGLRHRIVGKLRADLERADLPSLTWSRFVGAGICCAVLAGVLTQAASGTPVLSLTAALLAAYVPTEVVRSRARRRERRLRDVWPDVVDNIASAVRAGLALPEAVAQVAVRGPATLRPAFTEFAQDYRLTGRFGDGLDLLKVRLADPVADRLIESLRLARDVGGSDLGRLLRTLSAFLRDDARTRAELEARQSWSVNAARLAVVAPWLVLAMLATRAESLRAYNTPSGALVLGAGLIVTAFAYRLMLRIGRLPVEERVLR